MAKWRDVMWFVWEFYNSWRQNVQRAKLSLRSFDIPFVGVFHAVELVENSSRIRPYMRLCAEPHYQGSLLRKNDLGSNDRSSLFEKCWVTMTSLYVRDYSWMIVDADREDQRTRRKTCVTVISSIANPTWTTPWSEQRQISAANFISSVVCSRLCWCLYVILVM